MDLVEVSQCKQTPFNGNETALFWPGFCYATTMRTLRISESKDSSQRCFLDAIPDGHCGIICKLHCKSAALRQRLMELGLNVKTVIRKRSVAGGVICEIGHARFALGHKVCRQIEVILAGANS